MKATKNVTQNSRDSIRAPPGHKSEASLVTNVSKERTASIFIVDVENVLY
jgi:hypothetical protein